MHCQLRSPHTRRSFPSSGPSPPRIAGIAPINANRETDMRIAEELLQVLLGAQAEAAGVGRNVEGAARGRLVAVLRY